MINKLLIIEIGKQVILNTQENSRFSLAIFFDKLDIKSFRIVVNKVFSNKIELKSINFFH
jgi:hypothetical protein